MAGNFRGRTTSEEADVEFRIFAVLVVTVVARRLISLGDPGGPAVPSALIRDAENKNIDTLSASPLRLTDQGIPVRPGHGSSGRPIILRTNYFEISMSNLQEKPIYQYLIKIDDSNRPAKTSNEEGAEKSDSTVNVNPKQSSNTKNAKAHVPNDGRLKRGTPVKGKSTEDSGDSRRDDEISARKIRRLIKLLLNDDCFKKIRPGLATDYASLLFTNQKIDLGPECRLVKDITYQDEIGVTAARHAKVYKATVSAETIVPIKELLNYLASVKEAQDFGERLSVIEALNSIIARKPSTATNVFSGARNSKFYSVVSESHDIHSGLIAVKGIFSSVRPSTQRLLLNVNVTTAAFFNYTVSLSQLMQEFIRRLGHNNHALRIEQLEKFLAKRRISTDYEGLVKTHTIQGLANESSSERGANPNPRGGTAETLKFRRVDEHGNITCSDLPCVNTSTEAKKPRYIPAELCRILPGQPYGKKLSASQTTNMLRFAAQGPAANARRIMQDTRDVLGIADGNEVLKAFGMSIEPKLLAVEGRVLAPPSLVYQPGKSGKQDILQPSAGKWNIAAHSFRRTEPLQSWAVLSVFVSPKGNERDPNFDQIDQAVKAHFTDVVGKSGLGYARPAVHETNLVGDRSLEQDRENDGRIEKIIRSIPKVQVLFVILSRKDQFIYNRLKFYADTVVGMHCVCATAQRMGENKPDTFANIAHKMNLKMGGVNHALCPDALGLLDGGNTMLVGIDVTHPSPGSIEDSPSIAAVVASTDPEFAQFPASLRTQKGKVEIVSSIKDMMSERLDLWRKKNGRYPGQIIVFRDGVSESQYEAVLTEEYTGIKEAYRERYTNQQWPKTAMIVVGKRHHTRFYPTSSEDSVKNGNPRNGTVVDRGITMDRGWDFYLQAHDCLQGTARPAHYVVILNEFGKDLDADKLEQITHNLCYIYGRATKAVSICPPAYYADLACERARCYLQWHCNINEGDPKRKYIEATSPWTGKMPDGVKDSMFYI